MSAHLETMLHNLTGPLSVPQAKVSFRCPRRVHVSGIYWYMLWDSTRHPSPIPKIVRILSNCSGSSWRSGAQAPYRSRLGWSAGAFGHVLSSHAESFLLYLVWELRSPPFLPNQVTLQLHFRCSHELRTLSETFHTYQNSDGI